MSYEDAICLHGKISNILGDIPFVMALNKYDLKDEWALSDGDIQKLKDLGWSVVLTSAKTGEGVEQTFHSLAEQIMNQSDAPQRGYS
jgi:Fe2+ transport system protein B